MNCFFKPFVTLFFFLAFLFSSFCQSVNPSSNFSFNVRRSTSGLEVLDEDCPTALEIQETEGCGNYQFVLGDGQPNEEVYWYFDDGTYDDHASHFISHHYANHGTYAGYALYSSDLCSSTAYNFFLIVPACSTDGVDELNFGEEIEVYPNPVQNQLIVQIESLQQPAPYVLVNILGQTVLKGTLTDYKNCIDLQHLPDGKYQLLVRKGNDLQSQSILITH